MTSLVYIIYLSTITGIIDCSVIVIIANLYSDIVIRICVEMQASWGLFSKNE